MATSSDTASQTIVHTNSLHLPHRRAAEGGGGGVMKAEINENAM
jgi:hypothetical protein